MSTPSTSHRTPRQDHIRVIVSGGGTGGHIYPALAVAQALQAASPVAPAEVLYLHGPARIDEEVMAHAGVVHRRLDVGPIRGTAPHRLFVNGLRLLRATAQALGAIRGFRAQAVLATGGYVSAPTMLAAALSRVPVVLYLPDASPGLAVRAFAPLAKRIALSFAGEAQKNPFTKMLLLAAALCATEANRRGLKNRGSRIED